MLVSQFNRVCRMCLAHIISDDACSSLFTAIDLENGDSREISQIIENCINLKVTNGDHLPKIVCLNCTTIIRNFYVFRVKCHKNDKYLHEQIDAWKIKYEFKDDHDDQNLLDMDIKSVEDDLRDIDPISHQNFDKTDQKDIAIFEDVSDARALDDSSNDYDNDTKDDFKVAELNAEESSTQSKVPTGTKLPSMDQSLDGIEQCVTFHKCDICFEIFDDRKDLLFHRRTNHINEISEEYYTTVRKDNKTHYICKLCDRFCKHKNVLRVHLRMHTGEKPYKCAVCPLSFAQKGHARKHMKTHNLLTTEKKRVIFYKCGSCKEEFESEVAVKIHYELLHQETDKDRPLSKHVEKLCDLCGKFIKDLNEHLRLHAGGKKMKKYTCKICGRILNSSSSLSNHRKRHSDERKFICDTCGKGFKLRQDLALHRKIHSEERNHECQLCGRKFLHNNRLRIHLKVHAGEKPYQVYDDRKKEKRRLQQKLRMEKSKDSDPKSKLRKKNDKTEKFKSIFDLTSIGMTM